MIETLAIAQSSVRVEVSQEAYMAAVIAYHACPSKHPGHQLRAALEAAAPLIDASPVVEEENRTLARVVVDLQRHLQECEEELLKLRRRPW